MVGPFAPQSNTRIFQRGEKDLITETWLKYYKSINDGSIMWQCKNLTSFVKTDNKKQRKNEYQLAEGTTATISRLFFPLQITLTSSIGQNNQASSTSSPHTHPNHTQHREICRWHFPLPPPFKFFLPRADQSPGPSENSFSKHSVARYPDLSIVSWVFLMSSDTVQVPCRAETSIKNHRMYHWCFIHWPCLFFLPLGGWYPDSAQETNLRAQCGLSSAEAGGGWNHSWWRSLPVFTSFLHCLETMVP